MSRGTCEASERPAGAAVHVDDPDSPQTRGFAKIFGDGNAPAALPTLGKRAHTHGGQALNVGHMFGGLQPVVVVTCGVFDANRGMYGYGSI